MDLIERKRREIASRGLMGYPVDDAEDRLRIEGIEALLRTMAGSMEIVIPGRGIRVPWDAGLPAQLAYYLAIGDYEHHDLDFADEFVSAGDMVMELGGGVGITGVALGRASGTRVVVVEANPDLHDRIGRTFAANGCEVEIVAAAAAGGAGSRDFHIAGNYWWSSLNPREGGRTVEVATVPLVDLLARHRPTVLAIDIEGEERSLVGTTLDEPLHTVLIEIHTPDIGTAQTGEIVSWLGDQGFRMRDVRANSWAFTRRQAHREADGTA